MTTIHNWDDVETNIQFASDSTFELIEQLTISFLSSIGETVDANKQMANHVFHKLSDDISYLDIQVNHDTDIDFTEPVIQEVAKFSGVAVDHNLNIRAIIWKYDIDLNIRYDLSDSNESEEYDHYEFLSRQPKSGIHLLDVGESIEHGSIVKYVDILTIRKPLTEDENKYSLLDSLLYDDTFNEMYEVSQVKQQKAHLESVITSAKESVTKQKI